MSNTYPKESRKALLDRDGGIDGSNWTLRLYRSLAVPIGQDLTLADITEADYSGYAGVVSTSWSAAFVDVDGLAKKTLATITFAHDGGLAGCNVLGYYLTWDVPGPSQLVAIEKFSAAKGMFSGLDSKTFGVTIAIRQGV